MLFFPPEIVRKIQVGRKTKEPEQQINADRGLEVIEGELGTVSKIRHVRSEGRLGVADEKIYDDG